MNIKIIEPSSYGMDGKLIRNPRMWITGLTAIHLAALTPDSHNVSVCNEIIDRIDFDEDVDVAALSAMGPQIFRAIEIAGEFRKRGVKVIIGGYQASFSQDFVDPHVDSIIVGEAETVWAKALDDVQAGSLKRRYYGSLAPLEALPAPRYDLLDRKRNSPLYPVEATRGCANSCNYCSVAQRYRTSYRTHPVPDVIRNIEIIKSFGIRNLFFVDNNLTGDVEYAKSLFKAMRPLKMRWTSQVTVDMAEDPELLDLARSSGCISVSIGFESINQESLKSVGKGFNRVDAYRRIIREIRRRGIHVNALIMFGFDEDKEDIFINTADFFHAAGVSLLDCFIVLPTPGTPLFDRLKRDGRILTEDYREYDVTNVVFQPAMMSQEALKDGLWAALRRFYGYPKIVNRLARNLSVNLVSWGSAAALNILYRRMVYGNNHKHPNIWHAPYVEKD
ncbi:MAG: B12-binding domain-containing radical SAM protein [Deltaproteobacteria bacterium]|nr:B12-binding domain-containing radical SAM protein [Deltaproteobacteria bacterium]